jgi:integrase
LHHPSGGPEPIQARPSANRLDRPGSPQLRYEVTGKDPLATFLQIKLRLGHKEIRTTMDTYGHLFPSAEPEMAGLLDAAYRGVEARPAVVSLES